MYRYKRAGDLVYARIEKDSLVPETLLSLFSEELPGYSGVIAGIGGLRRLRIGVFRGDGYDTMEVEPLPGHVLEVLSLQGSIISRGDSLSPHLHIVAARSHGEVYAGHLVEAEVEPFLEIYITLFKDTPTNLREVFPHRF